MKNILPNGITRVSPHVSPVMRPQTPRATLTHGLTSTIGGSASVPGCPRDSMREPPGRRSCVAASFSCDVSRSHRVHRSQAAAPTAALVRGNVSPSRAAQRVSSSWTGVTAKAESEWWCHEIQSCTQEIKGRLQRFVSRPSGLLVAGQDRTRGTRKHPARHSGVL